MSNDATEKFFRWYDHVRLNHFGIRDNLVSLEIGPGKGYFAKIAGVRVVVDVSDSTFEEIERGGSRGVVGSASCLPFGEDYFDAVYALDVLHHLKAEGILRVSCTEVKRVLKNGGAFCVSDRLPTLFNSVALSVSKCVRSTSPLCRELLGQGGVVLRQRQRATDDRA